MLIYTLTVMVDYLNGRASPGGVLNFPSGATLSTGFRKNDVLKADGYVLDANGITKWYNVISCHRNNVAVSIPVPTYASDGGSANYLRVDSIIDNTPIPTFPKEIFLSLTENGIRKKYVLFEE